MQGIVPVGRTESLLMAEHPGLRGLPWTPLAHVPTPVEPCTAIEDWLGRDGVFIKRDDLVSPLYGGNKIRKYENVLAQALERGSERVVTAGGTASTQVTATALFGKALGLGVTAVLFDQPVTAFGRRGLLTDASAGAELIHGGGYVRTAWRTIAALRKARKATLIMPGAANAFANLGYVDAMLELSEQVKAGLLPRPDVIVLPCGSGGTVAAIALGAAWLDWPTIVVGVRITAWAACNRLTLGHVTRSTARFLARHSPAFSRRRRRPTFEIWGGAVGPGYGHPTPDAIEGIGVVERLTGSPGEVTYTGKALAGVRALGRMPRFRDRTILYWHTLSSRFPPLADDAAARLPPALARVLEGDVVV